MKNTLVILGAGGHAKVCHEIAEKMNKWSNIIFLDDNLSNQSFKITGPISDYKNYKESDFFVGIGSNKVRKKIFEMLEKEHLTIVTLIHPHTTISRTVNIGIGTVIMPGVILNASTLIGKANILNTACTVDHDNVIGDFVHISPGSNLSGEVKVGELSWIGMGSSVINKIEITRNVTLGAGSTVVKNIITEGTYVGTPVRRIG
ncbi:acetyltransferase [Ruoffia sp. FAM 26254]|uniref:acetyltransferase n=1 Tax=Ruoffia sp. FAM 26254 TaxID=3259518 RepID=UPI00388AE4C4